MLDILWIETDVCVYPSYSLESLWEEVMSFMILNALLGSKGILGDFSLICKLNCYQTISLPICL